MTRQCNNPYFNHTSVPLCTLAVSTYNNASSYRVQLTANKRLHPFHSKTFQAIVMLNASITSATCVSVCIPFPVSPTHSTPRLPFCFLVSALFKGRSCTGARVLCLRDTSIHFLLECGLKLTKPCAPSVWI